MFIAQGKPKENPFYKYIIGSAFVILASFVGQVPFLIAVFIKSFSGKKLTITENPFHLFDKNTLLLLLLISFVFSLIGLYWVVKKLHHQTFISIITARKKIDWSRFFLSFTIWGMLSAGVIVATFFFSDSLKLQFQLGPFLVLCVIALVLIPIQTSTEELVFRGYLMQGFYNLCKNKLFPLIMTSCIFGLMHIMNPEVQKMGYLILVYYIGTGLFLGILTLMDEGTELALGFHAANNLVAALLITSDFTVFQTHSVFKDYSEPNLNFEAFFPVFVLFPMLLLVFAKKYHWTDWKSKLIGTTTAETTVENSNEH